MSLSEQDVRRALQELGRLRFGSADVDEAMRDIVQTTHSIFQVDGAGLMLTDGQHRLRVAAASDERVGHLEELQLAHREGPALDAYDSCQVVGSEDLGGEVRWPSFGPAARALGLWAIMASPLPFQQQPVGVVVVVSCVRRPWSAATELALVAFTDLAALLVSTMLYAKEQSALAAHLHEALDTTRPVARAAAALASQEGVSLRAGHHRLRAMARHRRLPLADVALAVLAEPMQS